MPAVSVLCYNVDMKDIKSFIVKSVECSLKGIQNKFCDAPLLIDNQYYDWVKDRLSFGDHSFIAINFIEIKETIIDIEYQLELSFHLPKKIVIDLKREFDQYRDHWFNDKKWSDTFESYLRPTPLYLGEWCEIIAGKDYHHEIKVLYDKNLNIHAHTLLDIDYFAYLISLDQKQLLNWLLNNKILIVRK